MNRILLLLSVFFILLGCQKSATGPEPATYPIYVKAGSYTGTYTENRHTYEISINIYKESERNAWHIDIASTNSSQLEYYGLDTTSDSSIATVTNGGLGYIIDFENKKATSTGGTDKGYIYKLVKKLIKIPTT